MLPLSLACLLFLVLLLLRRLRCSQRTFGSKPRRQPSTAPTGRVFQPPKPPWVRDEVIRLKALMPDHGCRKIAVTFNHLHQERRGMTVGKTYVAKVLRDGQAEVLRTRRRLKHRRPRPMPRNVLWALDLTCLVDADSKRAILGLVDHGTRTCLALQALPTKSSVVLRALLDAVEQFGKPRALRTDNEAVFTSRLFRLGLWILGIRHQKTAPFAPWQNGRIERFFGTFKDRLRGRGVGWGSEQELADDLHVFRNWYNHVRPHHHLDERTPAEAWDGGRSQCRFRKRPRYVCEWEGALTGFYFPT